MVVPIDEQCSYRAGLLRPGCGRDAIALCVYCGAPFCEQHGERHPDYVDVCSRRRCRQKYVDVQAHHEFIEKRRHANRVAVCAHEGCQERMRHRCARCLLEFCVEHVRQQDVSDPADPRRTKTKALVCEHCQARRKLWR